MAESVNKKLKGTGDTGLTSHDEEQKVTATVEGGRASLGCSWDGHAPVHVPLAGGNGEAAPGGV